MREDAIFDFFPVPISTDEVSVRVSLRLQRKTGMDRSIDAVEPEGMSEDQPQEWYKDGKGEEVQILGVVLWSIMRC
jgi:hypothetical protein